MRELYIEGVAIHGGPESCAVVREDGGEALTGVRAGQALSLENGVQGADAVELSGRQHRRSRYSRAAAGRCVVRDPVHVRNLHAREPGGPMLAQFGLVGDAGSGGNAKAASP
jgi:hypothetical protein